MSRLSRVWRNLRHRSQVERDLDDELRAAFDFLIEEKTRSGIPLAEARRSAALEMGRIEAVKDRVRDIRTGAILDTLLQDLRYAARLLRRNPLFTATAALSVAVAIAANTTLFSIASALLLRAPSGIRNADRLVDIGVGRGGVGFNPGSYPNYLDIRARATTLDDVYASELFGTHMTVSTSPDGAAETAFCSRVTLNYFEVLAVAASVGRLFGAIDGQAQSLLFAGAGPPAVLSHRFWTGRFNRDPGIVGRTIRLDRQPYIVAGVAASGFRGTRIVAPDVWLPFTVAGVSAYDAARLSNRADGSVVIGGRLRPAVTVPQAAAEVDAIGRALEHEYPDQNRGKQLRLVSASPIPGANLPVGLFLALLMVLVTMVLTVACSNVAGILLARAAARRREIAVRLAMGISRRRLIRQMLTETVLLFAVSAVASLVLARLLASVFTRMLPLLPFPVEIDVRFDRTIIAFTTGLSLAAALLTGLVPALHASKTDVVSALKDDFGPARRAWVRHAFVVLQVAFSLAVIVAAGLFVRALQRAGAQSPGFEAHGVELASINLSPDRYGEATGPGFVKQLVERVRAMPDVESATVARVMPGGFEGLRFGITVPGLRAPNDPPSFDSEWNIVAPGYFATLRIPLLAGRDFNERDRQGSQPVAIVGEGLARRIWPARSALGNFITQEGPGRGVRKMLMVVGVARDITSSRLLDGLASSFVYVPLEQQFISRITSTLTIAARTTHGQRIPGELRALVASIDPNLPLISSQTLEDAVSLGLVPQHVAVSVSASLGVVGLILAAIGFYGVTAFAVTRRTREIGIRIAQSIR